MESIIKKIKAYPNWENTLSIKEGKKAMKWLWQSSFASSYIIKPFFPFRRGLVQVYSEYEGEKLHFFYYTYEKF